MNLRICEAARDDLKARIHEAAAAIAGSELGGELLIDALVHGSRHPKVRELCMDVQPVIQAHADLSTDIAIRQATLVR